MYNLRCLAPYSSRMAAGDYAAVYDVFAPDFMSHVTARALARSVAARGHTRPCGGAASRHPRVGIAPRG